MGDKLTKGLAIVAIGGIAFKTIKAVRDKKLQKELYSVEVIEDETANKE